jgi:hypothetical protein
MDQIDGWRSNNNIDEAAVSAELNPAEVTEPDVSGPGDH